jgi:iron-sulfur cluster repair protein YtfE (RIC family)
MADPIALLKQDHKEAKQLLRELADSRPGSRRQVKVTKLSDALLLHMQIEQEIIYPVVAERVGAEAATEANTEHDLARDGIASMQRLVAEPGFGAAIAILTAGINHHVKEEEQEVFPKLKKKLDRDRLMELGNEVARAKGNAKKRVKVSS